MLLWFSYYSFKFKFCYIGGTCQNPEGQLGTCISIRSCTPLLNLLTSNSQNRQVANFLRASVCGYEGSTPWVCCPSLTNGDNTGGNTGGTNNGLEGDQGRTEIRNTTYGPLYPPDCGLSSIKPRRIVGGEPASLGTNDCCTVEEVQRLIFSVAYRIIESKLWYRFRDKF